MKIFVDSIINLLTIFPTRSGFCLELYSLYWMSYDQSNELSLELIWIRFFPLDRIKIEMM